MRARPHELLLAALAMLLFGFAVSAEPRAPGDATDEGAGTPPDASAD